jgi:hypothetical protein
MIFRSVEKRHKLNDMKENIKEICFNIALYNCTHIMSFLFT